MSRLSRILLAIIVVGTIISVIFSIERFFVRKTYIIEYEAQCNPLAEHCFIRSCEGLDDSCRISTFKIIKKYARDVARDCGNDVRDCAQAQICNPTDRSCEIIYCNTETVHEDTICAEPELEKI
jgi:hypothetical protein